MTSITSTDTASTETLVKDTVFNIIDIETTGNNYKNDAITEIAVIKVKQRQIIGSFQTLIKPDKNIPEFITRLTGITDAMVATAPTIAEVMPELLQFISNDIIVAHNATFDISFLQENCRRLNCQWPTQPYLCTLQMSRKILNKQEVKSHKLSDLSKYFHSQIDPTHRALADVQATAHVLYSLIEKISPNISSLEQLNSFMKKTTK